MALQRKGYMALLGGADLNNGSFRSLSAHEPGGRGSKKAEAKRRGNTFHKSRRWSSITTLVRGPFNPWKVSEGQRPKSPVWVGFIWSS